MWKEIKKVILFVLAALGLMFIILMLWPEDEEKNIEETVVLQTAEKGTQ